MEFQTGRAGQSLLQIRDRMQVRSAQWALPVRRFSKGWARDLLLAWSLGSAESSGCALERCRANLYVGKVCLQTYFFPNGSNSQLMKRYLRQSIDKALLGSRCMKVRIENTFSARQKVLSRDFDNVPLRRQ